jgi:hypothetical protein
MAQPAAPTRLTLSIALVAWLCAMLPAVASAASIDRLMEASGIRHTLDQFPKSMLASIDAPMPGAEIPEQIRQGLREAALQGLRAEPIIESVRARLARELPADVIDACLKWLDAPLGKHITGLENAASEASAMPAMAAYAQELQTRPPLPSRLKLIEDLVAATGGVDTIASVMEASVLATALGVNAAQPRQSQAPADLLRRKIREALPDLRTQAQEAATVMSLYVYRSLDDRQLGAYLEFLRSPPGAAYSRSTAGAVNDAMTEAMGRFMLAIPRAIERSRGAGRT